MFRHRQFAGKDLAGCVTAPLISQGFAGFEASGPQNFLGAGTRDSDGPSELTGMIVYTRVADSGHAATPPKKLAVLRAPQAIFCEGESR